MSIIWCLILISHLFSSVGLNSVGIELFVNMDYFINVFFVDKLFFTAESRSPAWPCNVEYHSPLVKNMTRTTAMMMMMIMRWMSSRWIKWFFIILENKNTNINLHHLFIMVKMVPSDLSFQIFLSDQWNSVRTSKS
jgi:hypothetical protein